MKKIFAFLLVAAMLVSMFAVTSLAADLSYTITGVNVPVGEGQIVVCTSLNDWANSNPNWAMNLQLTPNGSGYVVEASCSCPAEKGDDMIDASGFSDVPGDVYVILHDGGVNPDVWTLGKGMDVTISNIAEGGTITFSGEAEQAPPAEEGATKKVRLDNNLAKGKSYETSLVYRMGGADANWGYDESVAPTYPDNGGELTDGKVADDGGYGNSAWVGLHGATPDIKPVEEGGLGGAWVVVDLGEVCDISKTIVYLPVKEGVDYNGAGINMPYSLQISVSEDGSNWTDVKFLEDADVKAQSANFSDYISGVEVETVASARYVRAVMGSGTWAFISEIAVIGGESSDDAETSAPAEDESSAPAEDESSAPAEDESSEVVESSDVVSEEVSEEESSEPEVIVPVIPDAPPADLGGIGTPNANPSFVADVVIPENYAAGEEVVVTITINDITVADGLHTVELDLIFDNDKMSVVPAEEGSSAVAALVEFAEWEDMTKFETLEDGTVVVRVAAGTPGTSTGKFTPALENGQLTFNVKFIAKEDSTGGIAVCVPHASVKGSFINGETGEILEYVGNGDEAVIEDNVPTPDTIVPPTTVDTVVPPVTSDTEVPPTGDASAMIFFAIIALVAMAGSAVVVKTRK